MAQKNWISANASRKLLFWLNFCIIFSHFQCPTFAGPIKFDMSKHNNGKSAKLLLAISPPFIVDHPKFQLFAHFSKCDQLDGLGTRFLDMTRLFALLNLSKCDQAEGDVLVAPKTNLWVAIFDLLNWTRQLETEISNNWSQNVKGLAIQRLHFFKLTFWRFNFFNNGPLYFLVPNCPFSWMFNCLNAINYIFHF